MTEQRARDTRPWPIETSRTWVVTDDRSATGRLVLVDREPAALASDEVRLRVDVCGVCRTDLHLAAGELPPRRPLVAPGHEVVGRVVEVGDGVDDVALGERMGVAWLRRTCGRCRWCRAGAENLCPRSTYTGWDADGGYAEHVTVPAGYAYRIPDGFSDIEAAPLLCAGIIGYRALRMTRLPAGGRLGIYGFGASAHVTAQIAVAQGAELHVLTRGAGARRLALELGAASAGSAYDRPPVDLDAAILFAPVGTLVPRALEALGPGGTLAVAGIHLSDVPVLDYQRHLFRERSITSVTANTRADGDRLLTLAARLPIRPRVTSYPFEQAPKALDDLEHGRVDGAAVLVLDGRTSQQG
ncbi:MAG: zinc-binding alcohol dehydrogenase family protein [Nocardioidaceae bacterium]